jgi:hypothetical protein
LDYQAGHLRVNFYFHGFSMVKLLILAGVGAAVGVWFVAHRHGQLRGLPDATKATGNAPE